MTYKKPKLETAVEAPDERDTGEKDAGEKDAGEKDAGEKDADEKDADEKDADEKDLAQDPGKNASGGATAGATAAGDGAQAGEDAEGGDPYGEDDGENGGEGAEEAEEALDLEADLAEAKDKLLRVMAESENTRRRLERDLSETKKYAVSGIAKELLSVGDNLRRAIEAAPSSTGAEDTAITSLVAGVEMVEKELLAAMERHGIQKIEPLGEAFDHNFHQAMYEVASGEHPAGTIVEMLQAGYAMHDRLLRPAMVAVTKAGETESAPKGASEEATKESPEDPGKAPEESKPEAELPAKDS